MKITIVLRNGTIEWIPAPGRKGHDLAEAQLMISSWQEWRQGTGRCENAIIHSSNGTQTVIPYREIVRIDIG